MKSSIEFVAFSAGITATAIIAFAVAKLFHLQGSTLGIVTVVIVAAGLLVTASVFLWMRSRKKLQAQPGAAAGTQSESAGGAADDIDRLIREAEAKVAASRIGQGMKLSALPVLFVLGETGAGKTTDLLHCGLEPELLAGQVYQEGAVVPTAAVNVWFARKTAFVEAGGILAGDARGWTRLVRRLAPGRLQSVFGKKSVAPRAAIVCVDSGKLLDAKHPDAIGASARNLRARLEEMSQQLGSSFPVYVLFNKADSLPFFGDFARNLTGEEASQVLGATLPFLPAQQSGVYAEQETRRLTEAFNGIFFSLADCRPGLLAREGAAEKVPGVYEFPRQFRKIVRPAVQFLVELCRPSHLRAGPFLRGFYFTGMRMVAAGAASPSTFIAAKTMIQQQAPTFGSTATKILTPEEMAGGQAAEWEGGTQLMGAEQREVPQWLFLGHVFSHVLLQDRAGMGAGAASTKVNLWRRILLATAAAIGLIFIVGFLTSYIGNDGLESAVLTAARSAQSAAGPAPAAEPASLDSLNRLDALRRSLATLSRYQLEGPPLHLRWGLYSGASVFQAGRAAYFQQFRRLLFGQTQEALRQTLALLPVTPASGDAYSPIYADLKAYLITTSNPEKATCDFLTPELTAKWSAGRVVDEARTQLAQRQFDFYCGQLRLGNPYSSSYDSEAVARGRNYLAQFGATESIYQAMIADASKRNPPFDYSRSFPDAAAIVHDSRIVPGAFTKAGWASMQDAFAHSDRYFSGEEWVLGKQGGQSINRAGLDQNLRDLYLKDYVQQWRDFLNAAAVVRYAGLADASQKLMKLSGNQSPLLVLLCQVSQNTAVNFPGGQNPFQSVQQVVAPQCRDQYVQPPNAGYVSSLLSLQSCLDQLASTPPQQADAAKANCITSASQAKMTALQIAQKFPVDEQGHTERTVQKLMQEPIQAVDPLLKPAGPGNAQDVCAQFAALQTEYPFNPGSSRQASLDEINAFFQPGGGAISKLYQTKLTGLLIPEGARYIPKPSSQVRLNPAFLRFFNQAMGVQQALYPNSAAQPQFVYTLRPYPSEGIQSLTINIDGHSYTTSAKNESPLQFVWPGTTAQGVTLNAKFAGGSELTLLHYSGLWAVSNFFGDASSAQAAGNVWQVEWTPKTSNQPMTLPNGHPVVIRFDVDTRGAPFIFQRGYFSSLGCVSRIAQ